MAKKYPKHSESEINDPEIPAEGHLTLLSIYQKLLSKEEIKAAVEKGQKNHEELMKKKMQISKPDSSANDEKQNFVKARAYGGVVFDRDGWVLLRKPKDEFDGYKWTFAKGRPNSGEKPEETALREVFGKTGVRAEIVGKLSESFEGGTSETRYFVMIGFSSAGEFIDQTEEVRWADVEKARKLISETTNARGKRRDFDVLDAAVNFLLREALSPCFRDHPDNADLETWSDAELIQKIDALLAFIPVLESANDKDFPHEFIQAVYDEGWIARFNWSAWQDKGHCYIREPSRLERAGISDIRRLVTMHFRKDHFCEGHLNEMLWNGHFLAILRRLRDLRRTFA